MAKQSDRKIYIYIFAKLLTWVGRKPIHFWVCVCVTKLSFLISEENKKTGTKENKTEPNRP